MKILLCIAMLTSLAAAADLSGKWRGVLISPGGEEEDVVLTVRQNGETLTGDIGPASHDRADIREGKVTGDEVTFQVAANRFTFHVRLKATGGELKGDVTRAAPGEEPQIKQLKLKRDE